LETFKTFVAYSQNARSRLEINFSKLC